MATIDVTRSPKLVQLYFERVEGQLGSWRCLHCKTLYPDLIPFGPPPIHDCDRMLCSWCGEDGPGSHGICPKHFEENTGR
jgi:hypothetical protein